MMVMKLPETSITKGQAENEGYLEPICRLFCLQKKVFSNQNNGHLGSRYPISFLNVCPLKMYSRPFSNKISLVDEPLQPQPPVKLEVPKPEPCEDPQKVRPDYECALDLLGKLGKSYKDKGRASWSSLRSRRRDGWAKAIDGRGTPGQKTLTETHSQCQRQKTFQTANRHGTAGTRSTQKKCGQSLVFPRQRGHRKHWELQQ